MDQTQTLAVLVIAPAIGIVAVLAILRRDRRVSVEATRENKFGVSTEGMKRCPKCGLGNLVTDSTCSACGGHLPG